MKAQITQDKKDADLGTLAYGFLDRMFETVEVFAGRLIDLCVDTTEKLVDQAVQRLFGLLLLGVGGVFVLVGGAKALNQFFNFPGIGEMFVGALILFTTSLGLFITQHRKNSR